jgi:hypothetical protein
MPKKKPKAKATEDITYHDQDEDIPKLPRQSRKIQRIKDVESLLADHYLMQKIEDLVCSGASIGTVEAILGMTQGRLKRWLHLGSTRKRSFYAVLFQKYRAWAGEARAAAECQQLAKTPTQWIERNTSAHIVEEPDASITPISNISTTPTNLLQLGAQQAINAMKVLMESGISIDEALRKDQLHLNAPSIPALEESTPDDSD